MEPHSRNTNYNSFYASPFFFLLKGECYLHFVQRVGKFFTCFLIQGDRVQSQPRNGGGHFVGWFNIHKKKKNSQVTTDSWYRYPAWPNIASHHRYFFFYNSSVLKGRHCKFLKEMFNFAIICLYCSNTPKIEKLKSYGGYKVVKYVCFLPKTAPHLSMGCVWYYNSALSVDRCSSIFGTHVN